MSLNSFFKLVEIQTKVASVIPYILGTVFAMYAFNSFKLKNAVLFFMGMIVFDMTTTAINNYVDFIKAIKKEGFGYEEHNAMKRDNLNPKMVLGVIISMLILASILGIILVLNTDIVVLLLGIICFIIGIFYSFGPVPISRTPFGEVFSGVTMGFVITFLAVYIHIFDTNIVVFSIKEGIFNLSMNLRVIISIFVISMPAICGIANIMLANNICDMEDDIVNKRYTLPIFIGKENSLVLFRYIYYLGYISMIVGVLFKILPIVSLLALVTLKPVSDNINKFIKVQTKKDTFVCSVQNFLIGNVVYILTIIIGILINLFV